MNQFSMAAGAFALLAMPDLTNTLLALAAQRRGVRELAVLATAVVAAYLVVVVLLAVSTGAFLNSNPQIGPVGPKLRFWPTKRMESERRNQIESNCAS
ncbi:hypothetical protein [Rhizobium mongolense]|uniref:Threonine/homoserine/homoserine lactone efflux protein n=1 Tax=Rhizobium mongolense TaxID=57676 RepID=A0A7W6RWG2_9HYPH|nr:hypothetical protein [Rhizobium mongolense]MBB4279240.1 threonine/homoserine/homoserine lactone efflux protein [Rhizobium mongolense]